MRKLLILLILGAFVSLGFSISNNELREIEAKKSPTLEDAVFLLAAMDNPEIERTALDGVWTKRLAKIKKDTPLTVGSFGIVIIELGKFKPSIMYAITKGGKYATDILREHNIVPAGVSWNRKITGEELFGLLSVVREQEMKAKGIEEKEEEE